MTVGQRGEISGWGTTADCVTGKQCSPEVKLRSEIDWFARDLWHIGFMTVYFSQEYFKRLNREHIMDMKSAASCKKKSINQLWKSIATF